MNATVAQNLKGYELKERIGAGGFGAVYRAYQTTVGREVAIKIILPGLANQPDFIRRFEGEAQLIARLEHPHITPLHDYWRDPDGAYLVMRWLRGGSLRDALETGPFDLRAAALLLDQIAGALSLAHRNSIIHRDIKPGNILLDEDGNAYLTDFGIAKDLNLQGNHTEPDAIVGSLDYISPEQARSEPITPRTDIYSLGVTMYEVITGHHPFEKMSSIERLYKHINDPLPEITALASNVAEAINRVIHTATAKDPQHRYVDALAFAADFREAVGMNRTPTNVVELLTQREHEVLSLIIEGLSNKEIAQRLTVTLGTVKWYIKQIYDKLGVRSRVQAMVRARELNLLTRAADAPQVTPIPTEDFYPENPYKGLRAFTAADHKDFFGREKLTEKLLKKLEESADFARFLAVVGPSGSGKSSLVKAGLIPAIWKGALPHSEKWFVVEMLPGSLPLDELEIALIKVAAQHASSIREQLQRDENGLVRAAQLILPNDGSELLLVIDQFEEVFTLVEDEQARQHFLNLLHAAVSAPRSRVRVVVTMRADFYDRPLHYPYFGELVRSRMETILPLSAEELERAVAEPAKQEGVTFETGLISTIVAEVKYQPGALPLLQYALTELFERREGRLLTREAYQAIGGTVGALAKRADEIYASLDDDGREAARQMFLRLVTLGEGTEDTRRRTPRSELLAITTDADLMDEVIDTYAEYRLLSLDNDPATRTPTVEVAHEAILREWELLRSWLNESREDVRLQRQVMALAGEWRNAKQDSSFLVRGARLELFEKWTGETRLALTEKERTYLNASLEQRTKEQADEENRQGRELQLAREAANSAQKAAASQKSAANRLRQLVAVLVVAVIAALGLSGVAINQGQIAQQSASEAQNVAIVAGSQAALANGNTDLAIALAMEAVTLNPDSAMAQVALSEAAYAPGTIRTFVGHNSEVDGLALSSDGNTALSAAHDNIVILWDIATGSIIRRLEGHTASATSVAFMPDGLSAISASEDKTMIQWNLETGEIIRRFEGSPDEIWAFTISSDGLYAVSGGSTGSILLWDIQAGEIIRRFESEIFGVQSLEFSPDSSKLLSSAFNASVILWDVETGDVIHSFEGHTGIVFTAIFSPDAQTILSASLDGTMILWDIETWEIIRRFYEEGSASIMDAIFSPNGRTILSGGDGGLVLWDIQTAQVITRLRGHGGTINAIVFSHDGRTALSASADSTLRLWGLEAGQLLRQITAEDMEGWVTALDASPDSQIALAAWSPPTFPDPPAFIIRWDVGTGEEIYRSSLQEYVNSSVNGYVNGITFSPDGQTALIAIDNRDTPADVIVWDVVTGSVIRRLSGHPSGILSVAFSPDGRTVASVGHQGIIILWDVATGEEIRRFEGYEVADPFGSDWVYVGYSPGGQMLVTSHLNSMIVLWDVATGEEIRHFEGHLAQSPNIVFSADGQQAFSGSADKTAILWNVASGSPLHQLSDHSAQILYVDMTADGQFGISGSTDHTATLWDLQTGELIRRYNGVALDTPLFAPDNHTALVSLYPNNIELWRIDTTLDELLTWTRANRYIPELTCEQRELYRLEPLCSESALLP